VSTDPCTICHFEDRTARKPHVCSQCLGRIAAGEEYLVFHTLFESEWRDYKECRDCTRLREVVDDGCRPDACVPFEGLIDAVVESDNPADLDKLLAIMRRRGSPGKLIDNLARIQEARTP
jgi:hypothetical protein